MWEDDMVKPPAPRRKHKRPGYLPVRPSHVVIAASTGGQVRLQVGDATFYDTRIAADPADAQAWLVEVVERLRASGCHVALDKEVSHV